MSFYMFERLWNLMVHFKVSDYDGEWFCSCVWFLRVKAKCFSCKNYQKILLDFIEIKIILDHTLINYAKYTLRFGDGLLEAFLLKKIRNKLFFLIIRVKDYNFYGWYDLFYPRTLSFVICYENYTQQSLI